MKRILDKFFYPQAIAVVGASVKPEKTGHAVLQNLLSGGFKGPVFPVNPKYKELLGQTCYSKLSDLPQKVDMAVFSLPARLTPPMMAECAEVGIECIVVLSGGFSETDEDGEVLHQALTREAAAHGIRIIGPNCVGIMTPAIGLNATFAPSMPGTGRVAFISQSGALGSAILDWASQKNVGFSHFVSVGNMADIQFYHLIDYLGSDSRTGCILIYMESLTNARKFMSAARAFARSKPIVILKAGSSNEGAKAARSHTGALAGNDAVYDAAFRRAGIIRVQSIQQLFDCAQALAMKPLPPGKRLAIVTNAGGPAIIATDALIKLGGQLAELSEKTIAEIDAAVSPSWSRNNPVDVLSDATPDQFRAAVRACLFDPGVDAVLAILTAQSTTDPALVAHSVVAESKNVSVKPVYASWMGLATVRSGREVLEAGKIPWYPFPERAITTFMHMVHYRENLDMLFETPPDQPIELSDINRDKARQLVDKVRKSGRIQLDESESKQLLACYGIPVNIGQMASTADEAVALAQAIGYPVVMKIESPDIWHKTDVQGVRLDLQTDVEVRQAFDFLMENTRKKRPDARLNGVTVEKMLSMPHELLIGGVKDPVFGPVVVFGMGGVDTEIWQDSAIGLPPINLSLARHIVENTKVARVLKGYRNRPGVPFDTLYEVLCRFAYLLMDFPDIREFDINPFTMTAELGCALDASVTLEQEPSFAREPFEHLCIQPYPSQWIREATLRNGNPVLLRPIRPEDEPMEADLVHRTSKESLYFRFFGYVPGIDHKMLARFTHIDYDREMAIVAQVEEASVKKIAGVVRIVGDGWRDTAEYAILVADAWQGQGVGGMLTDYILEIAKAQGYKRVNASFLKINGSMRRLFERKGFRIRTGDDDSDYAELEM